MYNSFTQQGSGAQQWSLLRTKTLLILGGAALLGIFAMANPASANHVANMSDLLSDASQGSDSNHTITGTNHTAVAADDNDNVFLMFDQATTAFDLAGVVLGDIDIEDDGADKSLAATCAGAEQMGVTITAGADTIRFNNCTDNSVIASGSIIKIEIGTVAAGGVNMINNPASAGQYAVLMQVRDDTVVNDSGQANLDIEAANVSISATVNNTLTCTLAGVATSTGVKGGSYTTNFGTDASSINFGNITGAADRIGAHTVTVSTNATGGYTFYLRANKAVIDSAAGDDIDRVSANNATPIAWAAPSNTGDENGLWGYSTDDSTLGNGTVDRFTNPQDRWAGYPVLAATQVEVAYSGVPVSNQVQTIVNRLEVTALQEAGSYSGTTVFPVCTAVF